MRWVVLLVAAGLAGVAAAGVLWPYGRGRRVAIERPADSLDDERVALLRSLQDLEDEREAGALADEDYRALRLETERRAVAVLRAVEARRQAGDLALDVKELRAATRGNGQGVTHPRTLRTLPALGIGLAFAAILVPLIAGAIRSRGSEDPITGTVGGPGVPVDSIGFFEQRVQDDPEDVAARLDLARRYQDAGEIDRAVAQYLAALDLDADNAEAQANLGYLLFLSGQPEEGLDAVDRALEVDRAYPEALFYRGVILLRGLERPAEAATALRAYLEEAPYGSRRTEAETLLEEAHRS